MLIWGAAGVAVCVIALLLGRAFRFAADQARTSGGRGNAGTVGTVLLLVAVATGSAAAGGFFADRPEGAPYPRAAGGILACAVLLLLFGVALKAGAARRPGIHVAGVRGRALIRSVRRVEGRSIDDLPVYEIDMDASAPGIPPFRAVHLEAIPERMGETLRAGATWPILVEPSTKKVAIDWVSPPPAFDADHDDPPLRSMAPVTEPLPEAEPLATTGTPTAATRTIALVLVMVLLGTAASFVTALLDSDPPVEIVSDPEDARPRVDGFFSSSDTGFSVVLPSGWTQDAVEQGLALQAGDASIVVEREPRLEKELRRHDGVVLRLFEAVKADLEVDPQPLFIGVDPARRYDLPARGGSRTTFVVIVRLGRVYVVRLVAPEAEWEEAAGALADVLDTWVWYEDF